MQILDTTTKSIEILLGGAITTNQLVYVTSYADVTASTFTPGSADGLTNNTTPVTVINSPAASTQRMVKEMSIYNNDTVSATVTVRLNDNSTMRIVYVVTLQAGETLEYSDVKGFSIINVTTSNASANGTTLLNSTGSTIVIGNAVYSNTSGTIAKARANADATSKVIGFVSADVTTGNSVIIVTGGELALTTAQWDTITGQVGGLTTNSYYYLNQTTAGKFTTIAPTAVGEYAISVGQAMSTTKIAVRIGTRILL